MKRRGRLSDDNPHQLKIDWHAAESEPVVAAPIPEVIAQKPPEAEPEAPTRRHRDAVVARLPVPRPLPASIAAGRFGQDEEGKPIRPAADEVRAITVNHADKLIDLLDARTEAVGNSAEQNRYSDSFRSLIAAYAEDFGERAARQLEAFARRQASKEESSRDDQGWRR